MRPLLKRCVLLAPGDDGYLAFDLETEKLFQLNPLAALIVELADGRKTQDEILAEVVPLLGHSSAAGWCQWIAQAMADGLLIDAAAASEARTLSADELCQRATALRNSSHVLGAFLCQQRAIELDPDDPQRWYQLGDLAHIVGRLTVAHGV